MVGPCLIPVMSFFFFKVIIPFFWSLLSLAYSYLWVIIVFTQHSGKNAKNTTTMKLVFSWMIYMKDGTNARSERQSLQFHKIEFGKWRIRGPGNVVW